jgi:beta-phosphoglucomutase-like phosphatase (HAD superfamily)
MAAKYCRNLDLWKLLPELRRVYRLYLVYTGPRLILDLWRREYELDSRFYGTVVGVEAGETARDPSLYARYAELAGLSPAACAMVESTQHGFEAAETAGLPVYRYGSGYGLRRWLAARQSTRQG